MRRVDDLLKGGAVPHEVTFAVRAAAAVDPLGRWLDAAPVAPSVELFAVTTRDA